MKPSRWIIMIVLLLSISAGIVALAQRHPKAGAPAVEPPGAKKVPTSDLRIATSQPTLRTFSSRVPWIGVVQSRATVSLTALVDGRVEAIEVADQTLVKPGQIVMRLGGPRIESERAKREASIKSLTARLALANETIARLQQSLAEHLATKDDVAAAQKTQLQLQGQLQRARLALRSFEKQLHIVAPMTGIFTHRRISTGQTIQAGQVLGEIVDTDHLRIVASFFPPVGVGLEGKKATVRLDEGPLLDGTIKQVLPQADPNGATRVWIEGEQINRRLHPGQTVSGKVTLASQSALAVPASAIVYDVHEQPCVFVDANGTYQRRGVRLGLVQDGWVEVRSGLDADQPVVTRGAYELFYRQFNQQFKVVD